ncbi:MAG: hypothetical protein R3C61_03130 [Bacteroidia bacterium]
MKKLLWLLSCDRSMKKSLSESEAIPAGRQAREVPLGETPPGRYIAVLRTPDDTLIAEVVITP